MPPFRQLPALLGMLAWLALSGPLGAQQVPEPADAERWQVGATAYLWAASLDGDASLAGVDVNVDVPFSDVLEDLSVGMMGTVVARRGAYGFYVSPFFTRVAATASTPIGDVRTRNDTTFLGFGGLYRLLDWQPADGTGVRPQRIQVDAIAGARLVDLRLELNGRRGLPKADETETWIDPIIGLGANAKLTRRWELFAEGDVGGFGVGSDLTWQTFGGLGYRFDWPGEGSHLRAGYRLLSLDYEDGGFEWDVTYSGPFLGLTLLF